MPYVDPDGRPADRLNSKWEELANVYNNQLSTGTLAATGAGLKRQFDLYTTSESRTNPTCPQKVLRAKRAR